MVGPMPTADPATSFERLLARRPELHAAWRDFARLFWEKRLVHPRLLELARARIAQMLGAGVPDVCDAMRDARAAIDPRQRAALGAWWEHGDLFDATERACLRFAEQFVLDAQQISDADAHAVKDALGDAGLVAFVEALAILDGFSRFARYAETQP
jgi:alkylhydroperoxidase family enzyme